MAEEITDPKLDDEGNPIVVEGGEEPPKKDDPEGAEGAGKEEDPDDRIEEKDIPVRNSQEHIIARKNLKIKKLEAKVKDDDDDEELEEEEEEKGLQGQIDVLSEAVIGTADEADLQGLFKSDPESKKFENRMRSYMNHPAWKGVPPLAIYHHLAFSGAAAIGAKKRAIADKEADDTKGAGSGNRASATKGSLPTEEEMRDMSDTEITKLNNDIQRGKYELE